MILEIDELRKLLQNILTQSGVDAFYFAEYPDWTVNNRHVCAVCTIEEISSAPDELGGYAGNATSAREMILRLRITFYIPRTMTCESMEAILTLFGLRLWFKKSLLPLSIKRGKASFDETCRMFKIPILLTLQGQLKNETDEVEAYE